MSYRKIGSYLIIPVLAVFLSACTKDTVYLDQTTEMRIAETEMPDEETAPAFCYVYVCGAVAAPGVYELPEGSRVCDAIEKAGGFTEDAAVSVNLAEKVSDGQMIQIVTGEEATQIQSEPESADGRVNLNTATAEQLMTLTGIGQAKADSIITYRTEHGSFQSIEDIMNISGIKEGVFVKIKDSITVD